MSKIKLDSFVHYGRLFEVYGKLLSEDRQKIMSDYFDCNMTLVEIADERGVSRQAVLDAIDKSCTKLTEFENALHFLARREKQNQALQEILALTEDEKIKEKVEQILKEE